MDKKEALKSLDEFYSRLKLTIEKGSVDYLQCSQVQAIGDTCRKCGCALPYWQEHTGPITFCGGYVAKACLECANQISELIRANPLWNQLIEVDALLNLNMATAHGDEFVEVDKHLELIKVQDDIRSKFYDFVKSLFPVEKPKPVSEKEWIKQDIVECTNQI